MAEIDEELNFELPTPVINCPFCGAGDYDLVGLKIHIENGWCDEFNDLKTNFVRVGG